MTDIHAPATSLEIEALLAEAIGRDLDAEFGTGAPSEDAASLRERFGALRHRASDPLDDDVPRHTSLDPAPREGASAP